MPIGRKTMVKMTNFDAKKSMFKTVWQTIYLDFPFQIILLKPQDMPASVSTGFILRSLGQLAENR
jgi:hypothetical protein